MKRMIACVVLVVGITVVGCDTFSDFVPGLQEARTEITRLRVELNELIQSGDETNRGLARESLARLDLLEEWIAVAEAEAAQRGDEKVDLWSLADIGLQIGTYAGVPGLGVLSIFLNSLRRTAKRQIVEVVSSVEEGRDNDGTIDWARVRRAQEDIGVHDLVRGIRRDEVARIAAEDAAAKVT